MQKSRAKVKIILLCGGKGERLNPLTNEIPKPLLHIKQKPLLSYIIDHLAKYDLHDLIIATGYKSEKFIEYIKECYPRSKYIISDSGDADIIKRIQDCTKYIDSDFMVLYGDTITNVNIHNLINYHFKTEKLATMTVWPMLSQFGIVNLTDNNDVIEFNEKPKLDKWINIGYFYFNYKLVEMIKEYDTYTDFLQAISKKKILNAFKHDGIHITVNTIKELTEAENNIEKI